MNLTIPRTTLTELASWAARAIPAKPTNAVLAGLRLSLTEGVLTADGFDYEVHARGAANVDGDDFTVVVPGRMFADTVSRLDGDTVTLKLDGTRLALTCGRVKAAFPVLPAEDYPGLPDPVPALGTVDSDLLVDAVTSLAPMAARDATNGKPELTAIVLTAVDGTLTFAATDGYQMGRVVVDWSGPDGHVLVPAAALVDAVKNLDGPVALGWSESGSVTLSAAGRTLTVRTVAGVAPAFDRFFDQVEHETVLYAKADELTAAMRRVSDFIPDKAPAVLTITDDGIEISGSGNGDSECSDIVDATVKGPLLTLGVKPAFFLATIAAMDTEVVRIALNSPQKPMRVDVSDGEGSVPSDVRTAVLMPVRLAEPAS